MPLTDAVIYKSL